MSHRTPRLRNALLCVFVVAVFLALVMVPYVARGATQSPVPADAAKGPADILAATVGVRCDGGHGSGTMISSDGASGLVVTCAHNFRGAPRGAPIRIDVFAPVPCVGVGRLLSSDANADVAIVAFQVDDGFELRPVAIAPRDFVVRVGMGVGNAGGAGGGAPQVIGGRVTALNRYVGAPTVSVSGNQAQGRSGGGLFHLGMLCGVLTHGDPNYGEGLFAALPSVYAQLDRAGLVEMQYRGNCATGRCTTPQPTYQPRYQPSRRPPRAPAPNMAPVAKRTTPPKDDSRLEKLVRYHNGLVKAVKALQKSKCDCEPPDVSGIEMRLTRLEALIAALPSVYEQGNLGNEADSTATEGTEDTEKSSEREDEPSPKHTDVTPGGTTLPSQAVYIDIRKRNEEK